MDSNAHHAYVESPMCFKLSALNKALIEIMFVKSFYFYDVSIMRYKKLNIDAR